MHSIQIGEAGLVIGICNYFQRWHTRSMARLHHLGVHVHVIALDRAALPKREEAAMRTKTRETRCTRAAREEDDWQRLYHVCTFCADESKQTRAHQYLSWQSEN